jgi:hypothetical protein
LKGVALASMLKEVWLETYPEMKDYFAWVTEQKDEANGEGRLCYTTPMGMHRAGATYTAQANGRAMQSPSAEGFCTAVYHVQREMRLGALRDCVLHNEVHDEILASVPGNQERAWECVCLMQDIMEDCMSGIMPDVKISTEAALMTAWRKEAEAVYDPRTGLLVPWEPGVDYDVVDETFYLPAE